MQTLVLPELFELFHSNSELQLARACSAFAQLVTFRSSYEVIPGLLWAELTAVGCKPWLQHIRHAPALCMGCCTELHAGAARDIWWRVR